MKEKYSEKSIEQKDAEYPELLKGISRPPKRLYCAGNIELLNTRCVAVVGSRTTTTYGRNTAKAIARKLASCGITVVSGMALGIDSCAHEGALSVGGNTIAVLGCGTDFCYPPENANLMKEIGNKGLLVSEYPPGTKPDRYNFPNRNRIISGLCSMTVVVQARNRSGALITAELAAEQGREVMAVPGNIDSQYNMGNNKLIREGVMPVISIDDVLEPLGLRNVNGEDAKKNLSETEYAIFDMLRNNGEMSVDEVCYSMGKGASYVNSILSVMEMKGFIFSAHGKIFLANVE